LTNWHPAKTNQWNFFGSYHYVDGNSTEVTRPPARKTLGSTLSTPQMHYCTIDIVLIILILYW